MTCPEWQTDAGKLTIPVGKYQGALGYLLLDESAVTIHKKILFKTVERRIPYDQVATVAFEKDDEHKSGGFICIRSVQDKAIPLIRKENAGSDETSLRFIYTENEAMQKVAEFLEKVAVGNSFADEKVFFFSAIKDEQQELVVQGPHIPMGKYQGALGYLLLDESAVTIHKKILFKTVERRIPYDQVATVAFEKDDEHKSGGFICIRSVQDKAIPLIRKENAGSDETSLRFIYTENEAMQKVAEFLEKAVQVNRETFGISATEEVDKASELCCPQCMSRNIRCQARRSRSYVRTRVYTTPMARLIGSIIVLIATIISVCVKEYWYTCQECGFQWTSKKQ